MSDKKSKSFTRFSSFPISGVLLKSIKNNGFIKPTPIQLRSLKATLILDKHVLGASQTGSGKTLAYAIPMIERILKNKKNPSSILKTKICQDLRNKEDFDLKDDVDAIEDMIIERESDVSDIEVDSTNEQENSCPEAVVLVPTRELALQVKDEVEKLCKGSDIRAITVIGGLSQDKQIRQLKKFKPHIIIGTPGRLYDLVNSDATQHLNKLSLASIRTLVIDEADRMVEKGHFQELMSVIEIVNSSKQYRSSEFMLKVYLFSATLTFLHELPDRFKSNRKAIKDGKSESMNTEQQHTKKNKIKKMIAFLGIEIAHTKVIDLSDRSNFGRPSSEQLTEMKINCVGSEKDLYLYYFLINHSGKRTLVFCNSKDCLRRLSNVLKFLQIPTLQLHADMDQKKRMSSLEKFRNNTNMVLIATDVAARGLDVKDLECVIHYQVPRTCESYIHRSGRTARLSESGISLTLCEPKEAPLYRRLCNNINGGKDLTDYEVDSKIKSLLQPRVALAQQCDKLDHQLREKKSNTNWFLKASEDCDIELDEDELRRLSQDDSLADDAKKRRKLAWMTKQLTKGQYRATPLTKIK